MGFSLVCEAPWESSSFSKLEVARRSRANLQPSSGLPWSFRRVTSLASFRQSSFRSRQLSPPAHCPPLPGPPRQPIRWPDTGIGGGGGGGSGSGSGGFCLGGCVCIRVQRTGGCINYGPTLSWPCVLVAFGGRMDCRWPVGAVCERVARALASLTALRRASLRPAGRPEDWPNWADWPDELGPGRRECSWS